MERSLLTLLLLTLASQAHAASDPDLRGFYLGGAIGRATIELEDADSDADFKGEDTGYKLIAGYRIIDWVAVEASYTTYGKPDDRLFGIDLEAEVESLSVSALGLLPLGDFDLFARGGLAYWDGNLRAVDFGIEDGDDNVDPLFGLGAQYRVGNLILRAEWEALLLGFDDDDDDERDGDDWADMLSVGLVYKF